MHAICQNPLSYCQGSMQTNPYHTNQYKLIGTSLYSTLYKLTIFNICSSNLSCVPKVNSDEFSLCYTKNVSPFITQCVCASVNDLQNVMSCHYELSLHYQKPQELGWPGSPDPPSFQPKNKTLLEYRSTHYKNITLMTSGFIALLTFLLVSFKYHACSHSITV